MSDVSGTLEGDHIKVTASKYPFPTVCADTQSTDWFHAISRTLKWNERERQKAFVVVEEGRASERSEKPKRHSEAPAKPTTFRYATDIEDGREVKERGGNPAMPKFEGKYDIDDKCADRFASPPPHPPVVSPRHVGINAPIDKN